MPGSLRAQNIEMEKQQISKNLPCGISVSGECFRPVQLSARFQIKAREYGLTDSESLAVWVQGEEGKQRVYFKYGYEVTLNRGLKKLESAPKNWEL